MDTSSSATQAATALQQAFAKVLPAALVALFRQRSGLGFREFTSVEEAIAWVEGEPGVAWLHLFDRISGKLVMTARPPLKHEATIRLRPQTMYVPFGGNEKGRYRFELHANEPAFQIIGGNYASRSERDEAAEAIARLLHLPLDLDVPEET